MDFLEGLNPQQREAVQHVEGPLLILAGAGSGKTRVITHRISHLIRNQNVFGPSVLAVTFTNKAAGEMRERVLRLLEGGSLDAGPTVSTFHSFCVRLLRRDGASVSDLRPGFTTTFDIYDDDEQIAVLKQVYKRLGLDDKFMQHRAALSRISHAKNHKMSPADLHKNSADPKADKLAVRLLRHDESVRELWNRRLQFLMIDEYQDTNRSQYELMRLLSHGHKNVAVVGDEDQSIYGWRGADIRNILDFERDFPDARVIRLEQNYRSTKTILDAAGAVVANNKARKGKWLWTDAGEGVPIGYYLADDGEREALFIADTIAKALRREPNARVAILYRTNSQSRQIEEALRRYALKYLVVGGFSFYQRAEVKDALSYLKLLANPRDNIALMRILNVPARGIGKTTFEQVEKLALQRGIPFLEAIAQGCAERLFGSRAEASLNVFLKLIDELREGLAEKPADRILGDVLEKTGYRRMLETDTSPDSESRIANLEELLSAAAEAAERGESLIEFLDHAALVSDADQVDEQAQVSLLTMHNAKGLEYPIVFIAGMEEGLFPHSRSRDSEEQMEEERRLCYVAMTRAQKRLYLSSARMRRRFGGSPPEPCIPSRFLDEVPRHLVEPLHETAAPGSVDLFSERATVREVARRNTYTGKTYNSLDHITQFFAERGIQPGATAPAAAAAPKPASVPITKAAPPVANVSPVPKPAPPAARKGITPGSTVYHAKYGRGTVIRKEGDGDEAKLTISFAGHGLKKLVAKFAQLKTQP